MHALPKGFHRIRHMNAITRCSAGILQTMLDLPTPVPTSRQRRRSLVQLILRWRLKPPFHPSEVTSQVDWLSSNDYKYGCNALFRGGGFHDGTSRHRVGHRYSPFSTNDDGLSLSIEPSSRPHGIFITYFPAPPGPSAATFRLFRLCCVCCDYVL